MDDEIEFDLSLANHLASAKPRTLRLAAERPPIIVYVGGAEENEGGGRYGRRILDPLPGTKEYFSFDEPDDT
eukprot:16389154-Heterocapsa_arctica.AAC.1